MATKELVAEQPKTETFKEMTRSTTKAYHYMQRTVGPMALPDGTVNSDMLDMAVMEWLNGGYTLEAVHYIGEHKDPGGRIIGYMYGYHFVSQ